jgi:hypothetical protein
VPLLRLPGKEAYNYLKKNFSDDREALTKEGAPFETPSFAIKKAVSGRQPFTVGRE